jgi:hypothetical protein
MTVERDLHEAGRKRIEFPASQLDHVVLVFLKCFSRIVLMVMCRVLSEHDVAKTLGGNNHRPRTTSIRIIHRVPDCTTKLPLHSRDTVTGLFE